MNDECNKCPYHKVAFLKEEHSDIEFLIKEKYKAINRVKELENGIRKHQKAPKEIGYSWKVDQALYKLLEGKQ
jgi:hypothetical protein